MKNNPLISVIIPVYNVEPYLRRALESVCTQTYTNLEILCVDDGSTDGSLDILREYEARDSRLKVFTQQNAGVSVARNVAMDAATGEWIVGVDPDDYLAPHAYETIISMADEDVELICFSAQVVGDGAETLVEQARQMQGAYDVPHEGRSQLTQNDMLYYNVACWDKLFRRSVIEKHRHRFIPELSHSEDVCFFWTYLTYVRNIYFVPERLYFYCIRDSSASFENSIETNEKKSKSNLICFREVFAQYRKMGGVEANSNFLSTQLHRRYSVMVYSAEKTGRQDHWVKEFASMLLNYQADECPCLGSQVRQIQEQAGWAKLGRKWLASCRSSASGERTEEAQQHIALVADASQMAEAAALLQGLKQHASSYSRCVHLFTIDVPAFLQECLCELNTEGFTVRLHTVHEELLHMLPQLPQRNDRTAYVRMALPELLPDINRVLVLRCGWLAEGSLDKLLSEETGDCIMAQCADAAALLMDLATARATSFSQTWLNMSLLKPLAQPRSEQEALKMVFGAALKKLATGSYYSLRRETDGAPSASLRRYHAHSPLCFLPLPTPSGSPTPKAPAVPNVLMLSGMRTTLRFRKIRYALMEAISFGKRRRKYHQKRRDCSALLREIRRQRRAKLEEWQHYRQQQS